MSAWEDAIALPEGSAKKKSASTGISTTELGPMTSGGKIGGCPGTCGARGFAPFLTGTGMFIL
jgi:hypothetical protein